MFLTLRSISVFLISREIIQKNKKPGCLSSGFAFFMGYIDGNRFISLCTYRKCLKPLAGSKCGSSFFLRFMLFGYIEPKYCFIKSEDLHQSQAYQGFGAR